MVWLHFTEEQVWKMKPRKLFTLLQVHQKFVEAESGSNPKNANKGAVQANSPNAYIDQIGW